MTITKVEIYNNALAHLGVDPNIESETEETKKLRVLSAVYNSSRVHCLKVHDWGCAKSFFTLTEVGTKPSSWAKQYKWPNQMLKPRFIENANRKADLLAFSIGTYEDADNGRNKVIWSDVSDVVMCGTYDLTDTDQFSQELADSISAYMAWRTARQFTDSKTIKQQAYEFYLRMLAEGAQIDAEMEADDPEQDADWIRARGGGVEPLPEVIRT